ncbi:MAG: DUF4290 domain-containing protein [Salinivirgaceae bacterium]|nr:DUF4290 domain-containing protein [Salinivirgaceae bacterium]
MNYNTTRKDLVLPEYGRNIQKMVDHIKTVEDRDERNRLAKAIIQIMGNMNPHLRDVADYTHKLWDHLAIISDFDLDVDSPYPDPDKELLYEKPDTIPYKDVRDIRFKHYGRVLENMVKEAVNFPEGEEKDFLIEVICNQMKKSYVQWNRESITDELIFSDLLVIAKNQLKVPAGLRLTDVKDIQPKRREAPASTSSYGKRTQQNRGGSTGGYKKRDTNAPSNYKRKPR